jgi:sec-independent protein translocase protein TatC
VSQQDQALVEHLAELRKRIIWTLSIFLIMLVVTLLFVVQIFDWVVNNSFVMFDFVPVKLTLLGPGEALRVYFTVAGVAAIGLTLPFALYHLWQFIRPALEEHEAKLAFRFLPLVMGMFIAGILFGYFFIFPLLYKFLYQLGAEQFAIAYTAANYFSFMANMVVPFGFIFEMPVAVMFLTRIGILSPQLLIKVRKYAYFVIVVVASMISPPDLVAHLSVAAPMILLYEFSITVAKWMWRKREQALAESEAQWADEEANEEA